GVGTLTEQGGPRRKNAPVALDESEILRRGLDTALTLVAERRARRTPAGAAWARDESTRS
ncbi:hypothetical protein, partial [Asanoa sp. NPDC050611]|uniref:hypothetical protein n=1 Tax=Asanoa sp. NPDC050611 TaxID=3157098 RepID=UPI003405E9C8